MSELPVSSQTWSGSKRHYTFALLCMVSVMSLVDRQIIAIVLEPIKREFQVSDTAMGLLTGLIFAGFYVLAAAPMGRWADIGVRRSIVAGILGFWSVMTCLGGIAQSYWQLALTRIGVAIGEAGASPASQSMVADMYPLESRGKALAIMSASGSLGIFFSLYAGGWLSDTVGWRMAFVMVGLPGIIAAVLIRLTVDEPPRGMSDAQTEDVAAASVRETVAHLWSMKSYRAMMIAIAVGGLVGFGSLGWVPTFFIRVHGMSATEAGFAFGLSVMFGLIGGNLTVGWLSDKLGKRDMRWYMRVSGCGGLLATPFGVIAAWWPSSTGSVVMFALFLFFLTFHLPPAQTMVHTLVRSRMRGTAVAGIILGQNLIGAGLGPLLIGVLNDVFADRYGVFAARYSLSITMALVVIVGISALASNRWLLQDHARSWDLPAPEGSDRAR